MRTYVLSRVRVLTYLKLLTRLVADDDGPMGLVKMPAEVVGARVPALHAGVCSADTLTSRLSS